MMKNSVNIQVKNLVKKFGDFTAVDGISFEVNKGEIFGFLGPNGSGKTTTIRMMLGLLPPSQGEIVVLEKDIPKDIQFILPRIGYMSQHFSLYDDLTVAQNLQFYSQAYGISQDLAQSSIQNAVSLSGLEGYENTPTKDLSGGWRQRLALSAAILHQPDILFLDEPTAGVDPLSRRAFWDLLYILVADGITVFITTHYMDEAEHCHRLAFIQRGRIIAQGAPAEIKKDVLPGDILEISTPNPEVLMMALKKNILEGQADFDPELYGSLIHVVTGKPREHKRLIKQIARDAGVKLSSISAVEPSLEDVFIASMRDNITGGTHEK
jgi:ABC-2 type transport system ATP-binding protein